MSFVGGLRHLVRGDQFRRLFTVRLTSQFSDGIFQVALASYVLFSPERQPDAGAIAAALASVLLPFSVLGPFVGVFLDRWNRRQILVLANLVRLVPVLAAAGVVAVDGGERPLFVAVVLAISINRFFLAGLSAALPRVVERDELVLANSVVPTSGTVAFMSGLGAGSAFHRLPWGIDPDIAVLLIAAVGYACASGLALRIPRAQLGPDLEARPAVRDEMRNVVSGLMAGLGHLRERRAAAHALAVVGAHRFFYGLSTVATILLYRNYFNDTADTDAGLAGLAVAVLVSGVGFLTAAIITPMATQYLAPQRWIVVLLALAAVVQIVPAGFYTVPALLPAAFALGLSAQGVKICVDTLVQTHVDDAYRGRVFSIYDVVFNVVFVAAAAAGTVVIPDNGKSYPLLAAGCVGYAVTAVVYGLSTDVPRRQKGDDMPAESNHS